MNKQTTAYLNSFTFIFFSLIWIGGCKTPKPVFENQNNKVSMHPAPVVIYKTQTDCSKQVPIMLSDDPQDLISYPHPNDLRYADGRFRYPVLLEDGYYLDRKGIGPKTNFLRISYEEYAANPPAPPTLLNLVDHSAKILEIWHCYLNINEENLIDSLNFFIFNQKLMNRCKRIK